MQIRTILVLLGCLATALTASSDAPAQAQSAELVGLPVEPPFDTRTGERALAELRLPSGARVQFLALDAGVGVAEYTPPRLAVVTDLLIARWGATPLEIYRTLAPVTSEAPEALWRDHERRTSTRPRTLTTPVSYGVPIDNFDCDPPQNFEDDWFDTYDGVTSHVVSQSYEDFGFAQYDWYPGAHVYHGTGNNLVTHFGICNADTNTSFSVEVHRKITTTTNGVQQSSWHKLVSATIGYNGRFTFHANLPGSYRQRLLASSGTPIAQLAAGAAYTKSPPVGIVLK